MGKLIIVMWARLLGLTSASYVLWATLWAFYYRKFFWDFIDGELGPQGLIPSDKVNLFIKMIVTLPIIRIINLVLSLFTILLEYPLPLFNRFKFSRSIPLRIFSHFLDFTFAMLLYQTIDGAVFHLITGFVYFVAWL
ncbi:hypothetical protein JCM3765_000466 [Sporobolomyces pararoseus]